MEGREGGPGGCLGGRVHLGLYPKVFQWESKWRAAYQGDVFLCSPSKAPAASAGRKVLLLAIGSAANDFLWWVPQRAEGTLPASLCWHGKEKWHLFAQCG